MRDPAIKLFGKEILLPENGRIPVASAGEDMKVFKAGDGEQGKEIEELDADKDSQPDNSLHPMEEDEELHNPEEDPKTPLIVEENGNEKPPENESNSSDQKPLKKPDKILPCPRCNSMDTKFCYYNNYNVHQPRHFCKGCQRYWTAGGTMRNVPVGAGRRKNKNSASHCRHITISEELQVARMDMPKGVISFGPETPVWEKGPTPAGVLRSGIFGVEKENGSDCSSGSSVITTSNSIEGGAGNASLSNCFSTQVPCLQGYPWPYPAVPNSGFYPPGYPIAVYPVPYWNCNVPGAWPVPWIPPPNGANQTLSNPKPNSPLGKHPRELEEHKSSERTILIPKTLRVDDPDEAAKSSIWATLGIKNDSINRKGLLRAFEPKGDENKNYAPETPSSMRANPAAMSRSLNFQEVA